jgi:hypothetical protein
MAASWNSRKSTEMPVIMDSLEIVNSTTKGDRLTAGWENTFQLNDLDVEYSKAHHIKYPFASGISDGIL